MANIRLVISLSRVSITVGSYAPSGADSHRVGLLHDCLLGCTGGRTGNGRIIFAESPLLRALDPVFVRCSRLLSSAQGGAFSKKNELVLLFATAKFTECFLRCIERILNTVADETLFIV